LAEVQVANERETADGIRVVDLARDRRVLVFVNVELHEILPCLAARDTAFRVVANSLALGQAEPVCQRLAGAWRVMAMQQKVEFGTNAVGLTAERRSAMLRIEKVAANVLGDEPGQPGQVVLLLDRLRKSEPNRPASAAGIDHDSGSNFVE